MEVRLTMSNREIDRLKVIHSIMKKQLTWEQAAGQLDLSKRHIGRLLVRINAEGNKGIIHRLRGKPSNNKLTQAVIDTSINLVKTRYADFGPPVPAAYRYDKVAFHQTHFLHTHALQLAPTLQ